MDKSKSNALKGIAVLMNTPPRDGHLDRLHQTL